MWKPVAATILALLIVNAVRPVQAETKIKAGAIILNRDAQDPKTLIVDDSHVYLVGGRDFPTSFQGGLDLSVSEELSDVCGIQSRFFFVDDWTATANATTTTGAWIPGSGTLGAASITDIEGVLGSDLYSWELNGFHRHNDWLTFVAGVRWLSIDESLRINFMTAGPTDYADYDGFVRNDLWGAQGGADFLLLDNGGVFTLDGMFRAGLFGADTRYDGVYENGTMGAIVDRKSQAAFVGELGFNGNLFLTEDIVLSSGYQMLWVSGVGLIGNQIEAADWVSGTGVHSQGDVFYHGATVSVTCYR